jgi:hypothetical protein
MEEAEILCDRIGKHVLFSIEAAQSTSCNLECIFSLGIMVGGKLRCIGTPQHLKDKYGAGYQGVTTAERIFSHALCSSVEIRCNVYTQEHTEAVQLRLEAVVLGRYELKLEERHGIWESCAKLNVV